MKKYIIGSVIFLLILGFVANAQGGKFFRFAGLPEVYEWITSPQEFEKRGGDWNEIQEFNEPQLEFKGVNVGNEYQSTSTWAILGSAPATAKTQRLIVTNPSVLGSVVIASSTAHNFKIWNATSTTDVSSTTLMNFKASTTEGTYTFDAVMTRGVVVEMPIGFSGNFIVTWR